MTTSADTVRTDSAAAALAPRAAAPTTRRPARRLAATAAVLTALARHAWFVEDEVRGLADLVSAGDVCIDIGAEYGLYTLALAAHVGPRGHVHSIEPQPGPSRALATGARLAGGRGIITLHRHALAERAGHAWMAVPRRAGLPVHGRGFLTSGAIEPGPNATDFRVTRWQRVAVTTLDALCAARGIDRVDFIKADVEGAELKMLRGGMDTLTAHHPMLQLEIQEPHIAKYGHHAHEVVTLLTDLGYTMLVWGDRGWRATDHISTRRRNYLFAP